MTEAMDGWTRKNLDKMLQAIERRNATFGKVLLGFAFSKNENNELRFCFGLIHFLGKGEVRSEGTYDYEDFVLTKKLVEVQDALQFLRSVFENQVLKFDSKEIPLKVRLNEVRFVPSRSSYGYISCGWPMLYTSGDVESNLKGQIPWNSLSKIGLPLYPSGIEAINAFFELHMPKDWHSLESRLEFIVPDYRARIKNLRLSGNNVAVEVETREIAPKDVFAKFYCKSENKSYTSNDLSIENGHADFATDEEPVQVETHILSSIDGNTIDQKKFDYRYPSREEGVTIENMEAQLLDVIAKGENMSVEFKKELDNAQFMETVVSFANTNGGVIFVGVDDNCRVKGFKEDVKARIVDLIADHCDPSIEVQIDSDVLVQGVPITLVKIREGTNKPYILKDRGIFVRRGSSDRQIKRTELDDIYDKRQSSRRY